MNPYQDNDDPLDIAIVNRLARLGSAPVDLTALDKKLRRAIPPRSSARTTRPNWVRGLAAVAAGLLLIVGVSLAFHTSELRASPTDMAQMHQDILSGKIPTMKAHSVDEANRAFAAMDAATPSLPQVPAAHAMACCMKSIKNKRVACLLMEHAGSPVTMVVAAASDMASPAGNTVTRNGRTYTVQQAQGLVMVMTERSGRWVCLISDMPQVKLMDLADSLNF